MLSFVEEDMFEGVERWCIRISEGLINMPGVGLHQGRLDHPEQPGEQVALIGGVNELGHQTHQGRIIRITEGGRLNLTEPLVEVLYMLCILPEEPPNGQFALHPRRSRKPTGQNSQHLILNKAVAIEQPLVVGKVNLFRRGNLIQHTDLQGSALLIPAKRHGLRHG